MATYAIGDIQGCYDQLQQLLELIQFDPAKDKLWLAGDLVNRGPQSLETLRLIYQLKEHCKIVLGNHDLFLLALANGYAPDKKHNMHDILQAPDRDKLLDWLRQQKLIHYSRKRKLIMVHAGIYPLWSIEQTITYANEVEQMLRSPYYRTFLANMFGNAPRLWQDDLEHWERLRFITNCLTRMRYISPSGKLNLSCKGPIGTQKKQDIPWYQHEKSKYDGDIIFGHWSTLFGKTNISNIHALDTGCLWGGKLTAMRVPKKNRFSEPHPIRIFQIKCGE